MVSYSDKKNQLEFALTSVLLATRPPLLMVDQKLSPSYIDIKQNRRQVAVGMNYNCKIDGVLFYNNNNNNIAYANCSIIFNHVVSVY